MKKYIFLICIIATLTGCQTYDPYSRPFDYGAYNFPNQQIYNDADVTCRLNNGVMYRSIQCKQSRMNAEQCFQYLNQEITPDIQSRYKYNLRQYIDWAYRELPSDIRTYMVSPKHFAGFYRDCMDRMRKLF